MSRNGFPGGAPEAVAGDAGSLKGISVADWARFGAEDIAYIRPVVVDGVKAIAIHAADGTPIGAAPSAELAVAAIIEHEMEPALVH